MLENELSVPEIKKKKEAEYFFSNSAENVEKIKRLDSWDSFEENCVNQMGPAAERVLHETEVKLKNLLDELDGDDLEEVLERIAEMTGVGKDDVNMVFAVLQNKDDLIMAQARYDVINSKSKRDRQIKKFIKGLAYFGAGFGGAFTLGLAGVLGVTAIRLTDRYFTDKRENEKTLKRYEELKESMNDEKYFSDVIASLYLAKNRKTNEEFLDQNEEDFKKEVADFVEDRYSEATEEIKEKLKIKYLAELKAEKINLEKETKTKVKPSIIDRIVDKTSIALGLNNDKRFREKHLENKTIRSAIFSGSLIGLGYAARASGVGSRVIGALVGWSLGSAAAERWVKKKRIGVETVDEEELSDVHDKIKSVYQEYWTHFDFLSPDQVNKKIEEINKSRVEIDESLKDLERRYMAILVQAEKESWETKKPHSFIELKNNIKKVKQYYDLNNANFSAINFNETKEKALEAWNKVDRSAKHKKLLIKTGSALLGVAAAGLVEAVWGSGSSENPDLDSGTNTPDTNTPDAGVGSPVSDTFEDLINNGIDPRGLSDRALEIIKDLDINKVVTLESGDGVSKIFDGHMGGFDEVNFIDGKTGDLVIDGAGTKYVHPGDQVISTVDGEVYVISKGGLVDFDLEVKIEGLRAADMVDKIEPLSPSEISLESSSMDVSGGSGFLGGESSEAMSLGGESDSVIKTPEAPTPDSNASEGEVVPETGQEGDELFSEDEEVYTLSRRADGKLSLLDSSGNNVLDSASGEIIPDPSVEDVVTEPTGGSELSGSVDAPDTGGEVDTPSAGSESEQDLGGEETETNIDSGEGGSDLISEDNFKVDEAFGSKESFRDVLGKDFSDYKIEKHTSSLGSLKGYSVIDSASGKAVNIFVQQDGNLRIEPGLDLNFGGVADAFDSAFEEADEVFVKPDSSGAFSSKDLRTALRGFFE